MAGMRGLRSTLLLFLILVGLGAYIYFNQWNPPSVAEIRAARPKMLAVSPEAIERVTVRAANNDATTLAKAGDSWRITSPVVTDADATATIAITRGLANLEIRHVVEENPSDLGQYGLDPPRVEVVVKTAGDESPHHLLIGDKTPVGENLYTKLASENRVLLVAGSFDDTFNKSTWELRDRRVLPIDRVAVDSLVITGPHSQVGLVRQDLEWRLTQPLRTGADLGVVSDLVAKLTSAEMQLLVAADAASPGAHGLGRPVYTVTLGAGSSRATLEIGSKATESTTWARDVSRPLVFTIESSLVDRLKMDIGEFRRKDVFAFAPHEARRLEVTRNGQTRAYERTDNSTNADRAAWREAGPAARDVQAERMDAALSGLSFLRAVSFADSARIRAGLASPDVRVLVRFGNAGNEERVSLARLDDAPYALRAEWPDAARLDANAYTRVLEALDSLER